MRRWKSMDAGNSKREQRLSNAIRLSFPRGPACAGSLTPLRPFPVSCLEAALSLNARQMNQAACCAFIDRRRKSNRNRTQLLPSVHDDIPPCYVYICLVGGHACTLPDGIFAEFASNHSGVIMHV